MTVEASGYCVTREEARHIYFINILYMAVKCNCCCFCIIMSAENYLASNLIIVEKKQTSDLHTLSL